MRLTLPTFWGWYYRWPPPFRLTRLPERIARQAAELEALRRDYEARKRQLADLTRRKQQLQSQLDKVETDIRALTGGSTPAPAVKPRPAVAKGKSKSKSGVSLPEMLQQVLRDLGGPLTHRQLVEEMARRKFPTKSSDLLKQVTTRVGEMVKKGLLRRTKDGAAMLPGLTPALRRQLPSPSRRARPLPRPCPNPARSSLRSVRSSQPCSKRARGRCPAANWPG